MSACTTVTNNKEKKMKAHDFNNIVADQLNKIQETLVTKGKEYATDKDRLHNFTAAAAMQGVTPRDALGGMMIKHTVSVYDMIGDTTGTHSREKWDEKITDHISYLVLLKAIIEEEFNEAKSPLSPELQTFRDQITGKSPNELDADETTKAIIRGDEFESNIQFAPQPAVAKDPFEDLDKAE